MKKGNKIFICILLFIFICSLSTSLCGCIKIKPITYYDDTGEYTIHLMSYATINRMKTPSNVDDSQAYAVPSYVMYKGRKITVKEIACNSKSAYSRSFFDYRTVKRLIIPSTITKMDLSNYTDLRSLQEIDVSNNKNFVMIDGALYTKNKRQLLFCLYNYTGTLQIFKQTNSFLDKDGNLKTKGIFDGSHRFQNVEVEKGNKWCASVDGALYTKNKSELLYYSPYKTSTSHTLPKQFKMSNPTPLLDKNEYLQKIYVEEGNKTYKSIDGVLYTIDGTSMAYYPKGLTGTTFNVPAEMNSFMRANSFMMLENLQSITVAQGNTAFKSVDGVLYSFDGKELICYPTAKTGEHFAIPSTVKTVGDYAMYNVQNLQTLFIPASVSNLNAYSITSNIHYYVESERSEMFLRLEAYGVDVHYGVTLDEYLDIVSNWGE